MGTMNPPAIPAPGKPQAPAPAWQANISVELTCHECQITPANITEEFSSGDIICTDCGLVLGGRIIDTRSEWRTFSNDDQNTDDPSRVGDGPNDLFDGAQLSTSIAFVKGGSAASRDLSRTNNKQNQDKATKQLMEAYKSIGELCDGWQLPKTVTDLAKHLYKMVADAQVFKAKSQEVVIAGCIFIACRQSNVPRTFREAFALTKVSKKEIGKIFKSLEKFFREQNANREREAADAGQKIDANTGYKNTTTNDAAQLLTRYASQLGLDNQSSRVAENVARKLNETGVLAGRSPLSQCAASLYFASWLMNDTGLSSAAIGKCLGISDGTIKTVYKVMLGEKDKLVEERWLKPTGRGNLANLPPG